MKKNIINKLDCFTDVRNDKLCAKHTVEHLFSYLPIHLFTSNKTHPNPPLKREGIHISCAKHTIKHLFSYSPIHLFTYKKCAFTLAEVLITLGIIGVVAVLVLPSVINKIQDMQYSAARKKALNSIGQAVREITSQGYINDALNSEDFVENYLKKQLKIIKTCASDNLNACGIEAGTNKILTFKKGKTTMPKKWGELAWGINYRNNMDGSAKSHGFVMANGYAVNLFYNPNCQKSSGYKVETVCVFAIYDMNGLKRPNQVGKDIGFVTVMYPDERTTAVAPDFVGIEVPHGGSFENAQAACNALGKDVTLPNLEELTSLYLGTYLYGMISNGAQWSAKTSTLSNGKPCAYYMHWNETYYSCQPVSASYAANCLRR